MHLLFINILEREKKREDIRFHVTVNFEKQGNKTKLTMRSLFESPEELEK